MHGRKIIICTTFREFNGNSNDQIQRLFLSTLKKQTYQNYILVATTFGEKNVEKVLVEENIPHKTFEGSAGEGFRFSSTQVLENGISLIDKPESYIIMWTTCDDLFEPTFFEQIVEKLSPMSSCTALPHIVYRSLENYEKKSVDSYCWGGIDMVCFDGDVFLKPEVREVVNTYQNKGWGFFEYFLSGIGRVFCKDMINIWPAKLERINNDRTVGNETTAYFNLTTSHNKTTYEAFAKKYSLKGDVYRSIFCYKGPLKYILMRARTYIMITKYRLQNVFFKGTFYRIIPRSVKNLFRKIFLKDKSEHRA